jgi:hypothetical protein
MSRSVLPSTDRSTIWLAELIEATEAVATSTRPLPFHSEGVQSFGNAADVRPPLEPERMAGS